MSISKTVTAILGSRLFEIRDDKGKRQPSKEPLHRIVMAESTHLIWKLRCECRIKMNDNPNQYHSEVEIENRWHSAINRRLKVDRLQTDRQKFHNKALQYNTVLNTWRGRLWREDELPENWLWSNKVLVGRKTPETPVAVFDPHTVCSNNV